MEAKFKLFLSRLEDASKRGEVLLIDKYNPNSKSGFLRKDDPTMNIPSVRPQDYFNYIREYKDNVLFRTNIAFTDSNLNKSAQFYKDYLKYVYGEEISVVGARHLLEEFSRDQFNENIEDRERTASEVFELENSGMAGYAAPRISDLRFDNLANIIEQCEQRGTFVLIDTYNPFDSNLGVLEVPYNESYIQLEMEDSNGQVYKTNIVFTLPYSDIADRFCEDYSH